MAWRACEKVVWRSEVGAKGEGRGACVQGSQQGDRFVAEGARCALDLDTKDGDDHVELTDSRGEGTDLVNLGPGWDQLTLTAPFMR